MAVTLFDPTAALPLVKPPPPKPEAQADQRGASIGSPSQVSQASDGACIKAADAPAGDPPEQPRPLPHGSSMVPRNWLVIVTPAMRPPVIGSPDNCDSAEVRLLPVSANTLTKAGGSAPPELK